MALYRPHDPPNNALDVSDPGHHSHDSPASQTRQRHPLTRELLTWVLNNLSDRLYRSFRRQVRLVVHGGHHGLRPSLQHRESTQDIDYIHRSVVTEYRALGFQDAE